MTGLGGRAGSMTSSGRESLSDERYTTGMAVRRSVLGDAHVDRAESGTTAFDQDFQRFITEGAWGSVWSRPGLDRRTRSMLVIALLAALGHHEELALHLRATRNTGATVQDVQEVLLMVAVYAGVPAANAAIRIAKQIYAET
jgi:4-carboxymuconolactone decarboxylase